MRPKQSASRLPLGAIVVAEWTDERGPVRYPEPTLCAGRGFTPTLLAEIPTLRSNSDLDLAVLKVPMQGLRPKRRCESNAAVIWLRG